LSIARTTGFLPVLLGLALAAAQEPAGELLHEGAGGVIEIDGERRLALRGLQGTLYVREGAPGEVRYEARTRDNRRAERAVAVWAEEATIAIVPVADDDGSEVLIEVAVPPGFDVRIDADASLATVSALSGRLTLSGAGTDLAARGMKGPAEVTLRGGKVLFSGADEVVLRGSGLEAKIEYAASRIELDLKDSSLEIVQSDAAVEGELENTTWSGSQLGGPIELAASGGSIELQQAGGGGRLELGETTLALSHSRGPLEIVSDARVEFNQHGGALKISGYGAEVHGSATDGPVEIETDHARVTLQQIGGQCTVAGRELEVTVMNPTGELAFRTVDSTVVVKKAAGPLSFESEFGRIVVEEALERIQVASHETEVRLTGLKAPVQVQAEGGEVEVIWFSLTKLEESTIENDSGAVRLRFPSAAAVHLDVKAPHGQVEGELPGIRISEDGHSATGLLGTSRAGPSAERPRVRVRAGADVYLASGS
jgi:hypothetical protein